MTTEDIKKIKDPKSAAKALQKYLIETHGTSDREVNYYNESPGDGTKAPTVVFEGGPYDWAIPMSFELSTKHWYTEPYYGFDLSFITP